MRDDLFLYVVADGAGGHNAGEVAAALAARSISNFMGATVRKAWEKPVYDRFGLANGARRLAAAICKANKDVIKIAQTSNAYHNMVATVVAANVCERSGLLHVAHVGDSRCYRLRSCVLEQLTHDHSLLSEILEREPDLDDDIVARMPRNVVTRALGMEQNVRVSFRAFPVMSGDRYLLCSDGLTGMVNHADIESTLSEPIAPSEAVERLIQQANDGGGKDNVSVIVVDVEAQDDLDFRSWYPPANLDPDPTQPEVQVLEMGDRADLEDVQERLAQLDSMPPDLVGHLADVLKRKGHK